MAAKNNNHKRACDARPAFLLACAEKKTDRFSMDLYLHSTQIS